MGEVPAAAIVFFLVGFLAGDIYRILLWRKL